MTEAREGSHGFLADVPIGISVSDCPDLLALGFTETHLRMALAEVARGLLLADASIIYGGRIDPEGYTDFLRREMEKYSRRDRPMKVCLAWSEHRRMSLEEISDARRQLGLYGDIVLLDLNGHPVADDLDRDERPCVVEPHEGPLALSALRRYMNDRAVARIFAGGRRHGYQGRMPGVLEEAQLAVETGRPVFFAGGFGGVTGDMVSILGLDPAHALAPVATPAESGITTEYQRLRELAEGSGWTPTGNGLSLEEARRLGTSHRPAEISSLVAAGMRRLKSTGRVEGTG